MPTKIKQPAWTDKVYKGKKECYSSSCYNNLIYVVGADNVVRLWITEGTYDLIHLFNITDTAELESKCLRAHLQKGMRFDHEKLTKEIIEIKSL